MTIKRWMKWTAAGVAAVVLTAGFCAHRADAQGLFRGRHGKAFERISSLGITPEQWEKIHAIVEEAKPKAEPLVKQFVTERRAMRELVLNGGSESDIRAQAEKLARTGGDLAVLKSQVVPQIRAVLTTEQQDRIKDMVGEFDARVDLFLDHLGSVE